MKPAGDPKISRIQESYRIVGFQATRKLDKQHNQLAQASESSYHNFQKGKP
jgi:hypothetical protein